MLHVLWLSVLCAPAHGFAPSRGHLSARPRHAAAPSVARSAGAAPPQSEDSSSKSVDSGKRVFVRNIAWKADVGAVRAHFERFGRVHQAWLAPNPQDAATHRGYGFVTFVSPASADAALAAAPDALRLHGRALSCYPATENPSPSHGGGGLAGAP